MGERDRRVAAIPVFECFIAICENHTPRNGPMIEPEKRKIAPFNLSFIGS